MSNRNVIILIGAVMAVVFLMVFVVLSKAKQKPQSPQAMVAAALNSFFTTQEWQPGMGPQPFLYHPAAQNQPAWQPLPGQAQALAPVATPMQVWPAPVAAPAQAFGQPLGQTPSQVFGQPPGQAPAQAFGQGPVQAPSQVPTAGGAWSSLPSAGGQGGVAAFQQPGIRAYRGPVQ